MLPTFIIAGAAKSGSTSFWMYVKEHPEVCMAPYRELRFFTRVRGFEDGGSGDERGPRYSGRFDKGLDWYQSLFNRCEGSKAIGEISLSYMGAEDAPGLMKQIIPNVKVIFILRDPAERVYSNYWEERKGGRKLPDFETMMKVRHPRLESYIYNSSYHLHLTRYTETFPREQLFAYLYDDLRDDPLRLMRQVYLDIGVNPGYEPTLVSTRYNPAAFTRVALFQRLLSNRTIMNMSTALPLWLFERLGRIRRGLVRLNRVTVSYPPLKNDLRRALVTELMDAVEYVEDYLNRPLPSWRKVT